MNFLLDTNVHLRQGFLPRANDICTMRTHTLRTSRNEISRDVKTSLLVLGRSTYPSSAETPYRVPNICGENPGEIRELPLYMQTLHIRNSKDS